MQSLGAIIDRKFTIVVRFCWVTREHLMHAIYCSCSVLLAVTGATPWLNFVHQGDQISASQGLMKTVMTISDNSRYIR